MKTTNLLPAVIVVLLIASACGPQTVPVWGVNVTVSVECERPSGCEPLAGVGSGHPAYEGIDGVACWEAPPEAMVRHVVRIEGTAADSRALAAITGIRERRGVRRRPIARYDAGKAIWLYELDARGEPHAVDAMGAEVTIDGRAVTARYRSESDPGRVVVEKHELVALPDDPCQPPASRFGGWGW